MKMIKTVHVELDPEQVEEMILAYIGEEIAMDLVNDGMRLVNFSKPLFLTWNDAFDREEAIDANLAAEKNQETVLQTESHYKPKLKGE